MAATGSGEQNQGFGGRYTAGGSGSEIGADEESRPYLHLVDVETNGLQPDARPESDDEWRDDIFDRALRDQLTPAEQRDPAVQAVIKANIGDMPFTPKSKTAGDGRFVFRITGPPDDIEAWRERLRLVRAVHKLEGKQDRETRRPREQQHQEPASAAEESEQAVRSPRYRPSEDITWVAQDEDLGDRLRLFREDPPAGESSGWQEPDDEHPSIFIIPGENTGYTPWSPAARRTARRAAAIALAVFTGVIGFHAAKAKFDGSSSPAASAQPNTQHSGSAQKDVGLVSNQYKEMPCYVDIAGELSCNFPGHHWGGAAYLYSAGRNEEKLVPSDPQNTHYVHVRFNHPKKIGGITIMLEKSDQGGKETIDFYVKK